MTQFNIYQIRLTNAEYDQINREGHESVPANVVKMKLMFGKGFVPEDFAFYTKVAVIEADGLDDVFVIGNFMGDDDKITPVNGRRMSSVSVGDLIENKDTGEFELVASVGFEKVEVAA